MTIRLCNLILCLVLLIISVAASSDSEEPADASNTSDIQISFEGGLLSIETSNAPLHHLIHEIGERAGFRTILAEEFINAPLVNVSFKNASVLDTIERLVSDKNRIIFFAPASDGSSQSSISQVWLLSSSNNNEGHQFNPEADDLTQRDTFAFAQENVVNDHKLIKLASMLQQNQPEALRTRAAIALGKVQDSNAVVVLEPALQDQSSAVRSQAIKALGRIGDNRATMLLGNILMNSTIETSERVIAAKALQDVSSEQANAYLRSAQHDSEEIIRMISGLSSSSNKSHSTANNKDTTNIQ